MSTATNQMVERAGTAAALAEVERDYIRPTVNIYENQEGYVLEAELPGVNKDGVSVSLEGNLLTLEGRRARATASEAESLYRETQDADFRRVFEVDPATGAQRILHTFPSYYGDGGNPNPDLIYADGRLFGTTRFNGKNYCGSVFKINLSTNLETTIHRFPCASSTDGATPEAGVIYLNGELYGTTNAGGINNRGTVYKISPSGAESLIYSF